MKEPIRELAERAQLAHCVSSVRLQEFADILLAEVEQAIWSVDDGPLAGTVVQAVRQRFGVDA